MRNAFVALLASASVLAPQVALAETWNDSMVETVFNFDKYVSLVYLDSVVVRSGYIKETGEDRTENHVSITQTPYCDSSSALSLNFTLQLTNDYGYQVNHTEKFFNVPENSSFNTILFMNGYNIVPTNASIAIYSECEPLNAWEYEVEEYEYDPEVLESIETEIENLGDSVTEGVEAVGDVFGDVFGW